MLYLTCTTITSIDLAHYGLSRAKDWVSVKCGTSVYQPNFYGSKKNTEFHNKDLKSNAYTIIV